MRTARPTIELLLRSGNSLTVTWLGYVNVAGPGATPTLQQWLDAHAAAVRQTLEELHEAGQLRKTPAERNEA